MSKPKTIKIDDDTYVLESEINAPAKSFDGLEYVVIRSRDSGCHAGYLKSEDGNTLTLVNSRRLWYWDGAASLSQLAMEGVSKPSNCKFPCAVDEITVYGVCEKILATAKAQSCIEGVQVWKG
jgi:hypothetical protein